MNDNQEKNSFDDDCEKEPFVKKAARFSAFLYLGLAIVVVIVATVGIFNVSYDYEESIPEISFPEVSFDTDFSVPKEESKEEPVGNEQSNIDADVEEAKKYYSPVSGEIVKFHDLQNLVFSQTMNDYRIHQGVDLKANAGTNVVAFTDGVVSSITDDYFYGTTVAITHDRGVVSYYMNLDPALKEGLFVGSEVKAGEAFAKVGRTARIEAADEPHLHFELRVNGELINPKDELPQ